MSIFMGPQYRTAFVPAACKTPCMGSAAPCLAGLAIVLVLVGCGGQEDESVPLGTPTTPATIQEAETSTVEVGPATTIGGEPPLASDSFRMPSGNIGCRTGEGFLRCDILSGLKPEPEGKCQLDWTGLSLSATGPAEPVCAGDTAYDTGGPVLEYGHAWQRGEFYCASTTSGLRCVRNDGPGFFLSRRRWEAH